MAKPARVVSEHEARQRDEQKALREAARARAEYLRELLGRRLLSVYNRMCRSAYDSTCRSKYSLTCRSAPAGSTWPDALRWALVGLKGPKLGGSGPSQPLAGSARWLSSAPRRHGRSWAVLR